MTAPMRQVARFGDELERIGWVGDAAVGGRPVAAFFELHIEQGPILRRSKTDIGVVTHGQGLNWIRVTLTGKKPIPDQRQCHHG